MKFHCVSVGDDHAIVVLFWLGLAFEIGKRDTIGAFVSICGAVQRLVNISAKMKDIADGCRAFLVAFGEIFENVKLMIDGVDYATGRLGANG